jgi:SAM-dependent methyltransferase
METTKQPLRLHLGCGDKYLEGYVNIDFPQSEHTVMAPKADRIADIRTLSFPEGTVQEVRSHHLLEHFTRPAALRLLMNWRRWLTPDGELVVETPDFEISAQEFLRTSSMKRRFGLGRHMFGSQEASWAEHRDFWDKRKFQFVLKKLGYRNIKVRSYWHGIAKHAKKLPGVGKLFLRLPESLYLPVLNPLGRLVPDSFYERHGGNAMPNVLAVAQRDPNVTIDEDAVANEILSLSLVGKETAILGVWLKEFQNSLR